MVLTGRRAAFARSDRRPRGTFDGEGVKSAVAKRGDVAGDECDPGRLQSRRPSNGSTRRPATARSAPSGPVIDDAGDAPFAEAEVDRGDVGSLPSQRVENNHGRTRPAGVDLRGEDVPFRGDDRAGPALGIRVASDRVFINMVGHDAGGQVVRLVEEHRLPECSDRAIRSAGEPRSAGDARSASRRSSSCLSVSRIQVFSSIRLL